MVTVYISPPLVCFDTTIKHCWLHAPCPTTTLSLPPEFLATATDETSQSADSSSTPDSGIVYDSAASRLSVKDKIARLRRSQIDSDISSSDPSMTSAAQEAKKKAMSLPKDAKLPADNTSSGGE